MNREVHVRFSEGLAVRFRWATRRYLSVRWHTQASRKQARYLESHHLTIGVSTTTIPPKPGIAYLLCQK